MSRSTHNHSLIQQDQDETTRKLQYQKVRRQQSSSTRAINQMLDRKHRHLLLSVTLDYKREIREQTTFDDLRRDRSSLFDCFDHDPQLKFVEGALYKVEQGENSGGLHLHMLIFGSGRYRNDINLCRAIGECWQNKATEGRGAYWNGNLHAAKADPSTLPYGKITGQIDRNDTAKRHDVIDYVTQYICKETQPVKNRGKHGRTFGIRRFNEAE